MVFIFAEFETEEGVKILINIPNIIAFEDNRLHLSNGTLVGVIHTRAEIIQILQQAMGQASQSSRQGLVVPRPNIPDLGKN